MELSFCQCSADGVLGLGLPACVLLLGKSSKGRILLKKVRNIWNYGNILIVSNCSFGISGTSYFFPLSDQKDFDRNLRDHSKITLSI